MATVNQAIDYANDVVNGDVIACKYVKQACERFLSDLANGDKRGLTFCEKSAQHILDWYQFIPHVKGALAGQPIALMDYHVFILANLYGWKRKDGTRRFRTAYVEVARKNAKSTFSSGVALYMTAADKEGGAEVYSAATTRDQARIVFDDAKNMIAKSPALKRLFGVNKLNIHQERSASKFEPLSADAHTLDGLNIHCGVVDEIHAHKTRDVWDVLETATGAREQPLLLGITTAGFNWHGIGYELRDYSIKVLGGLDDDSFFGIVYTLDEDDDPWNEQNWYKANPGLGICKKIDDMQRLAKKAKEQPAARANFFTKHLNIWTSSATAWMDMQRWRKAPQIADDEYLKQYPCWVGVDLANKIDIAAAVAIFRDQLGHYHIKTKFWLPEGRVDSATGTQAKLYRQWKEQGLIELTEGDVIDHRNISDDIEQWLQDYDVKEIAFDPWSAIQWSLDMTERGLPLVEVPQTVKNLSEAMKETERAVFAEQLRHEHSPVMNWMMSNVISKTDKNENIFPQKENPANKIDGPVALFTSMCRCLVNGGIEQSEGPSIRTL